MDYPYKYSIYHKFIKKFVSQRFLNIDRQDPLIVEMENLLNQNHQFFYIADLIQMKIIFTSSGSAKFLGTDPELVDPGVFFRAIHPDDRQRHSLGRSILFKEGNDLFYKQKGISILSTHFRLDNGSGKYNNIHFSGYSFFHKKPVPTVYTLMVLTDLEGFKLDKHGYHYYLGNDLFHFRYPDDELMKIGHVFSDREFEIIKCIARGMNSIQIANELFLSVNTVNTHRRNILKKTNKTGTRELIIELQERGVL
ncbi:MAG: helix-turn-helix transcriptional regulator [Saprospiraceae bacterium]|nr:helix-turn-helix transcriptional regulator [Saprospiraceae bacterium]